MRGGLKGGSIFIFFSIFFFFFFFLFENDLMQGTGCVVQWVLVVFFADRFPYSFYGRRYGRSRTRHFACFVVTFLPSGWAG